MFNFLKNIFGVKANEASVNEVNGVSLLTVGKVSDTTTSGSPIKRYMGIGVCRVLAVNPTAKEIEQHMGFTPKAEPVYLGEDQNGCKTARISMIVTTVPEDNNGIETTAFLTFNMTATTIVGSTSGKIQVMDEFGSDPAWGDAAVVEANKPIVYSDGRNPLKGAYHKVCRGEVALTNFLRSFLGVPSAQNYVNGTWVTKTGEELNAAKLRLENIPNYFKGDFSEIKEAIALMPDNKVKLLFGVRTNDEGKEYQDVNSEVFMSARSNSTKMMERTITEAKTNGRYANTEYDFEPLHEYVVNPTDFTATEAPTSDLPFSSTPW